ncbi:MAG: sugar ABC transporter ATP-binding protein, partial [Blautia sp.]|nr:sugar ABC transporter ATP-binding protein [Blautia sp.]
SLEVKEGEILGIGGLAGQGKLGIPNGIMGLYHAGGKVTFEGKEIPLNAPRRCLDASFAFVSEDRRGVGLLLDESLEWNIAFPAMQIQNKFLKNYLGGLIKWRDEKAIKEITDQYIQELAIKCTSSRQKAKELSGGNQQKVCLAKAFALSPRLLFVSEPTRGIDVGAKALVLEALKKFNRENHVTIVMVSSELEELRQSCDRIAIVSGGRVAGILPASSSVEELGALMLSQVI